MLMKKYLAKIIYGINFQNHFQIHHKEITFIESAPNY